MRDISFLNPEFFWLFLLLPIALFAWYKNRKKQRPTLKLSSIQAFEGYTSPIKKLLPIQIV